MDPRTSAARAEALAAREAFGRELDRLEASARAAVDIPAKVRRNPVKTAGVAAGAGFLALGGPGRLARRVRRALGRPEPLPKSMLPKEVDKTLRKLGDDGEKVRGTLEREFAKYLDEHAEERRDRSLGAVSALLLSNLARPATKQLGQRLAKQLLEPDGPGFAEQIAKVRERTTGAAHTTAADSGTTESGEPI